MSSQPPPSIELEFARRYDQAHARVCLQPHPVGLWPRLMLWRHEQLVRRALKHAGEPGLVLDLACGAGRFWPVLGEHGNRVVLAADHSQDMLNHALTHHSASLLKRIKTFQSSAFDIGLSANAVDCIFCMQLFQHLACAEQRLALLREFHRVSRDGVIVAVRIAGRCNGVSARLNDPGSPPWPSQGQPLADKWQLEAEFKSAGFEVVNHQDFIPGCGVSRVYVLRKRG
jgi:ubiquinone/menaquinone biosynthesis C-methylase UbiE